MNKFESEVYDTLIEASSVTVYRVLPLISTLHDNEMIAFAEWLSGEGWVYARLANGWVNAYDDEVTSTTSELLTIFREENK